VRVGSGGGGGGGGGGEEEEEKEEEEVLLTAYNKWRDVDDAYDDAMRMRSMQTQCLPCMCPYVSLYMSSYVSSCAVRTLLTDFRNYRERERERERFTT